MKTIRFSVLFLTTFLWFVVSCSKDDVSQPVSYQEENPIPVFLTNSGFNFSKATTAIPGGEIESGFSFIPKVKGKIKAIVAKLHVPNSNLRVTLWDKQTGASIATNFMNISTSGVEVISPISEISLQKDKEYVFSVKSQYFYNYQKENSALQVYPITAGNISITGSLDGQNSMPNFAVGNSFLGDYSFVFQQTE